MVLIALGFLLQVRAATPRAGLAEQSPLRAIVQPETVLVGHPFTLTLRMRVPSNTIVDFPAAPDVGAIVDTVGGVVRHDTLIGDSLETTVTYPLAAWHIGKQAIVLGNITMEAPEGRNTISLDSITVFVRSILPKDTTLYLPRAPRPTVSMPFDVWDMLRKWWWALLVAILASVGVYGGRKYWWRVQRERRDQRGWAESEFDRIEAMRLIEENPERYAILMTEVVRGYLVRQFRTVRVSDTSSELSTIVRHESAIPSDRVQQLFERADVLKFGAARLHADEARQVGDESRSVVSTIEETLRQEREAAHAAHAPQIASGKHADRRTKIGKSLE